MQNMSAIQFEMSVFSFSFNFILDFTGIYDITDKSKYMYVNVKFLTVPSNIKVSTSALMSVFVIPTPFSSWADRSISKKSRYFFVSS